MFHKYFCHFQIEHAQHLAPGTAARFSQQRVIASMQVLSAGVLFADFPIIGFELGGGFSSFLTF